jgi:hypothetical protein
VMKAGKAGDAEHSENSEDSEHQPSPGSVCLQLSHESSKDTVLRYCLAIHTQRPIPSCDSHLI